MLLYRYLNLTYGLEALQTGKWKIGRIAELNDPFDCRPNQKNFPAEINLGRLMPGFGLPTDFVDDFSKDVGLLCYSGVISDPVLWSHYADSHRGLALGFESEVEGDAGPFAVKYSATPATLDFNALSGTEGGEEADKTRTNMIVAGFKTKAASWSYEREYRSFVDLNACTPIGPHYFLDVSHGLLREVVLGARCPITMEDIKRSLQAQTKFPKQIKVRQCRMQKGSYEIGFSELREQADSP